METLTIFAFDPTCFPIFIFYVHIYFCEFPQQYYQQGLVSYDFCYLLTVFIISFNFLCYWNLKKVLRKL